MATADFQIKQDDALPIIRETLRAQDRSIVDLTGATVRFRMRADGYALKIDQPATIVDAANGVVEYTWQSGDTDTPGIFNAEWAVTFPGGVETVPGGGYSVIDIVPNLLSGTTGANPVEATINVRLTRAEANIVALQAEQAQDDTAIAALQTSQTLDESHITTLQTQMSTANGNIATLQGEVATDEANISTLQGQMSTANSNIATNTSNIATNTANIATNTSAITALQATAHSPVTLSAVGSSPNANGASLSGQALTLQPADLTHPGLVSTATQQIGGRKQFSGDKVIIDNFLDVPAINTTGTINGLSILSQLAAGSANSDWLFYTSNNRTNGKLLRIVNGLYEMLTLDFNGKLVVGSDLQCNNMSVGNLILGRLANTPIWIGGNRNAGDTTADIYLSPNVVRSAGDIVNFMNGVQIGAVSKDGMISAGVVGGGLNAPASFRDGSGSSGHVSLTCMPGFYTVIAGQLPATIACADGTQPYGGLHGDITLVPTSAREAGWLLMISNATAQGAATKFYVDYYGGIGQMHGLSLAQFGAAGLTAHTVLSGGSSYTGQAESTLMWADDKRHWYAVSNSAWKQIPFAGDATAYDATDGSGTAGSQTINKLKGKGKFAAGASTLTITNSFVTAASHVSVVLQTNDSTAILKNVVPAAGSFDVNIVACTADTVFSFVVEN